MYTKPPKRADRTWRIKAQPKINLLMRHQYERDSRSRRYAYYPMIGREVEVQLGPGLCAGLCCPSQSELTVIVTADDIDVAVCGQHNGMGLTHGDVLDILVLIHFGIIRYLIQPSYDWLLGGVTWWSHAPDVQSSGLCQSCYGVATSSHLLDWITEVMQGLDRLWLLGRTGKMWSVASVSL